ncbi:MAG TPA: ABC transporter substrate-binding protein [Candidatus Binatia bacterium]|nr:ABC transporter substrate-binding protein [Candidatus Binatia bacterium]
MRGALLITAIKIFLLVVFLPGALAMRSMAAEPGGKPSGPAAKIRLATPVASLSYLPIHVALRKGFFAKRGLDMEVIQMAAGLAAPALLNRAIDYTTIPSGPATAGARGLPLKVICFTSVKLQHVLIARPEITTISDLAGKRIGAGSFGTLPAYEVRVLIDRYKLGSNTVIVPLNSTNDRMIATYKGNIDATVVPAPFDLKAEEIGMRRLLQMSSILPIPQAGLATTEEKIKSARHEVIEILKATIEGLDYTWNQREGTTEIIARWMNLTPAQAARVYESVRDTYSKDGIPTEEQSKAYIAMLGETAGLKAEISASSIFDFSLAVEAAKEMANNR